MKRITKRILFFILFIGLLYGISRLYFHFTAGFLVSNITSDFAFQPQWETRPLMKSEKIEVENALDQPYYYLGKGCQSYVFMSQDQKYVIKFFKYQRYRLQPWLTYFPSLPSLVKYREEKLEKKWDKINHFVQSWKVAFENLKEETGLLFVHLNKTHDLKKDLTIYDKIGKQHVLSLDQMEFCIQHRAEMLCDVLLNYKKQDDLAGAKILVHQLLQLILSEYSRGLADNDHALMQNTGVSQGMPIHIDVGQFVFNEEIRQPETYYQELFTKTYKFNKWLKENYPPLSEALEFELHQIMGPAFFTLQPKFRQK